MLPAPRRPPSTSPTSPTTGSDRSPLPLLGPVRQVRTDVLDVGLVDTGPPDGPVALLLHGFPYDVHSHVDVVRDRW